MKSRLLAFAGALAVGGLFGYVSGPVIGVTVGLSVLGGALHDMKRQRNKLSSASEAKE
ncbi:hypothetical protein J2T11_002971 [Paenarthrobacter nicotinovorans]|nr:hypothetical protein [Paenarthrobacter nicotinovorans]